MAHVLMGLGEFKFSIETAAYHQLQRQTAWRWPKVERIGRPPALQYVGPGDDAITLSGTIMTAARGGGRQVDKMREAAAAGTPLNLVCGYGDVLGRWVIVNVDEDVSSFFRDGAPRKQGFSLKIQAYGEDEESGAKGRVPLSPGGGKGGIALSKAMESVAPLAAELSAGGLTPLHAATTLSGVTGRLADIAEGVVTDLAQKVITPALNVIGTSISELTTWVDGDLLDAAGKVIGAVGDLSPPWRDDVLPIIVGPKLTPATSAFADVAKAARAVGKSWP